MFCRTCDLKWVEGIAVCPKCHKTMEDTHYTQWLEKKAVKTYAVSDTGAIYCLESGEPLVITEPAPPAFKQPKKRVSWQDKKQAEEDKESAAIAHYLEEYERQGAEMAEQTYFETFK